MDSYNLATPASKQDIAKCQPMRFEVMGDKVTLAYEGSSADDAEKDDGYL